MLRSLDKLDQHLAWRRLTVTTIALRRYFDRHGTLPARLDDLMAETLLDAVPTDPFDGQPLRYDPRRGLLWSIGRDERDNNGSRERTAGEWTADELVALEFATP